MNRLDKVLSELPIISTMVNQYQVRFILEQLESVNHIDGDVVELGCNIGTTSIFLQTYLNRAKKLHCYDSFEGFPEKDKKDEGAPYHFEFKKGGCSVPLEEFKYTFTSRNIPLPEIHKGWFKDSEYPENISFAFLDSDFYTSIKDSLEKVYPRLVKGGKIVLHDYDWDVLPGVKIACDEFFKDKEEKVEFHNFLGLVEKL